MTIDDIWAEHVVCLFWGTNVDDSTIKNTRIRDTWADGLNFTNGSSGNHVANVETRTTGDDSFALFPAIDNHNEQETGNVFEDLTSLLTWRAVGLAVYGGAATLSATSTSPTRSSTPGSPSARCSSAAFPPSASSRPRRRSSRTSPRPGRRPFLGAADVPGPVAVLGEFPFRGLRISDVDIVDPTYSGNHVPDEVHRRAAAQPDHRHRPDERQHLRRARAVTSSTPSPASESGSTSSPKAGPGRRLGDLQRPGPARQLPGHQEHHHHVHHQPQLTGDRGPRALGGARGPARGPCPRQRARPRTWWTSSRRGPWSWASPTVVLSPSMSISYRN